MMKRLNEILSEIGISKVKLAKYLNVSRQMVYNYLEMEDVNGEKVNVQVVGSFDDNDKSYAIVSDLDDGESYYIFEIQTTDEGDMLVSIDDEDEFDRLCKVVESKLSENN